MKLHQPHNRYSPKARVISLKSNSWRKLRAQVLSEEPLCRICLEDYDIPTPATDVDHIDNDGDNNSRRNLQPLCHACHSQKTRDDMLNRQRTVLGCDADGYPLDAKHGWNITSNRREVDRAPSHKNAAAFEQSRK